MDKPQAHKYCYKGECCLKMSFASPRHRRKQRTSAHSIYVEESLHGIRERVAALCKSVASTSTKILAMPQWLKDCYKRLQGHRATAQIPAEAEKQRAGKKKRNEPLIEDAITPGNVIIDTLLVGKVFVDSDDDVANEFWEETADGELKCKQQVTAIPDTYHSTMISSSDHTSVQASVFWIAINLAGPSQRHTARPP